MPSIIFILLPYLLSCFSFTFCNTILQDEDLYRLLNSEEMQSKILETLNVGANGSLSSLKMLDASTKSIPSGILYGNFYDLGNFDECYNIEDGDIYGKYCLGSLIISIPTKNFKLNATKRLRGFVKTFRVHPDLETANLGGGSLPLRIAACVPSDRKAQNMSNNWNIEGISIQTVFTESLCYSKKTDPDLSSGAIATIVVYCIFGALIITSTAFDLYLYNTNKESPHELLLAFSFWTNGRKLLKCTRNPDQLLCLNGLRAISMMWVVLGHKMSAVAALPVLNMIDAVNFETNSANMYMMNASLSVDSFFVIGGLVLVYTFMKSNDKGVKFNIFLFYIHRILRLTPAFVLVGLAHLFLIQYMGHGPIWQMMDYGIVNPCKKGWWSSFLYISNYVKEGQCMGQTWYLAVDMQLFILSPLVLLPLVYWPLIGLGVLGFLILAGIIVPFGIVYGEQLAWTDPRSNDLYYVQPYTRFGPYVIGMATGYLIYQVKKTGWKLKLPRLQTILVVCCGWLIALGGLIASLYCGYDVLTGTADRWGYSLYMAFDRQCWGLCLSLLIFLCVTGYGGPINYFLSLSVFQFITKLSYSIYLLHMAVIAVRLFSVKNLYRFSAYEEMYDFWSDFMFTIFLSLITCLAFESPVVILEKYLFGKGKSPQNSRSDKANQA